MTHPTYQGIPQPPAPVPSAPESLPTKGFTILLMGDVGTGKTTSLKTLIKHGITPFILATEPGIQAIMGDLPKGSYHVANVLPGVQDWSDMLANAKLINSTTVKAIAEMGDIKKAKFQGYYKFIEACANFTCDLTGESFGPVDSWSTDRAICVDTLSGFNKLCMQYVIGAKPVASQIDWQIAQNLNLNFITTLLAHARCHVVVNAHIERETDEVMGGTKVMASSLGRKLAPLLPRDFDNVVQTEYTRDGSLVWNTVPGQALLKSRHLPRSATLSPSYDALVDGWKKTGGVILPTSTK